MKGEITCAGLGKAYRQYDAPWLRFAEWAAAGAWQRHRVHWALRDATLHVGPGEAVGIVGPNGAGKSTLLKLITGTTRPTAGTLQVVGRVAALLELGIGFHPEVTGRDNAIIAGQLLGHQAAEMHACMPAIEAFAEIGDFIDRPLRIYSSGMQVRLAFSIATAIRPDILIVDEALSVGDTYFQHKSFARIREFRAAGTTLLFVSHSAAVVKSLCDRAILLENGRIIRDAAPDQVIDYYHARIADRAAEQAIVEGRGGDLRSGDKRATIDEIALLRNEAPTTVVRNGESATLRVRWRSLTRLDDVTVGFIIRDALGNDVYGTNTYHLRHRKLDAPAGSSFVCEFDIGRVALGVGHYNVSIALHREMVHVSGNYDWWDRALTFEVVPGQSVHAIGVASLDVECRMKEVTANVGD